MAVVRGFRLGDREAFASPKIVITMPAYKAEATLARTVADIPAGIADQLILVDDASPDNTAALARELGVDVHVHPENRGYGANQKTCYTIALGDDADIVVMLHPDYQYEPKAVPLLIAPILAGEADMTFGSRFAGLGDPRSGGMPMQRYVGNRVTTVVENLLLGSRFSEMHSGMRAYTRRCLLSLPFLRYSGDFVFDSQLLIDAVTTGQRVVEVPIPTRYTDESSSIGSLSSLSYVGRSVAYCAGRVWSHGRRRHRSPIGRRDAVTEDATIGDPAGERVCALCGLVRLHLSRGQLFECTTCGLVSRQLQVGVASEARFGREPPRFLEWALERMRGYVLREGRLLGIGTSDPRFGELARATGWEPVRSSPPNAVDGGLEHVDAVLSLVVGEELLDFGGLHGLRSPLKQEGLFALLVLCDRGARSRASQSLPNFPRPETLAGALWDAGLQLVEWTRLPRAHAEGYGQWLMSGARASAGLARPECALVIARRVGAESGAP